MNLRRLGLLAMVLIMTATSCSKDEPAVVEEVNYTIDLNLAMETDWQVADEILSLVNDHRESIGLEPLRRDQGYASAYAVDHTKYMIDQGKISHDNIEFRRAALKNQGAQIVTENVAYGYKTAAEVVNAWLNSPGHRKAIEGYYTHSGFGVMKDERGIYYFTHIFYRK